MFDTASIEDIKKYIEIYPIVGVTSNPSILKTEGKVDLFSHMKEIRNIIGKERNLHVQVIAEDCDGMMRDAEKLLKNIDEEVYIKIPTTEDGLRAMRLLKEQKINITATAIYSKIQGFMAIASGADYIAPYYNRMENMDIDSSETIFAFREMIDRNDSKTKILAASFKNIAQVNQALLSGAHCITLQPILLHESFGAASVKKAVSDFKNDWMKIQEQEAI